MTHQLIFNVILWLSVVSLCIFGVKGVETVGPWPEPGGNAARNGRSSNTGPQTLNLNSLSSFVPDEYPLSGAAIDHDGNSYFVSCSQIYSYTYQGILRWNRDPGYSSCSFSYSTPVLGLNNTLYVVLNQGTELLTLSTIDGSLLWQTYVSCGSTTGDSPFAIDSSGYLYTACSGVKKYNATGGIIWSSSNCANGGIVISNFGTASKEFIITTCYSGNVTALNLANGAQLWTSCIYCHIPRQSGYSIGYINTISPPALSSSNDTAIIYLTTSSIFSKTIYSPKYTVYYAKQVNYLFAYNLQGSFLWNKALGLPTCNDSASLSYGGTSSPIIDSDGVVYTIYSNAQNRTYNTYSKSYYCQYQVRLAAINSATQVTTYDIKLQDKLTTQPFYPSPTVDAIGTVFASSAYSLSAINNQGVSLWNITFQQDMGQPAIGANGTLYIPMAYYSYPSYAGNLYLINTCDDSSIASSNGSTCSSCPSNEYKSAFYNNYCQETCDTGYYQSDPTHNTECNICPYPYTNTGTGNADCSVYCLCFQATIFYPILGSCLVLYLICIMVGEYRLHIFIALFFPTLDVFTDLAYLLTNPFINSTAFSFGIIFYSYSIIVFNFKIISSGLLLKTPWLTWKNPPFPMWTELKITERERIFEEHPEIHYLIIELIFLAVKIPLTIGLYLIQFIAWWIVKLVLLLPALLIGVPFLFVWITFGCFLHMTKTFCIGRVWNMWYRVFLLSDALDTNVALDTAELNESLFFEFLMESLPQFLLQVINNTLLEEWTMIGILSTSLSIYMSLNGFYRFWYLQYVKSMSFRDIPVGFPGLEIEPGEKDDISMKNLV